MNLLELNNSELIQKTNLTRKLTLDGVTKAYPVYRVRLDQLFYNDQNDRIATWITQYKNEESSIPFEDLSREEYNNVIERFIVDSNPAALEKTKNNIALVNQREPGVVLADGRIIDGNRRFTCLRLLEKEGGESLYFETAILDATLENSKKQIKLLELAIQHGEEQRVGYNLIDLAIGAYHDIVETELLTIEEYVESTNEPISEVRRRLETAKLIIEFLEFMNLPGQFHVAREMEVYSIFNEFVPLLRKIEKEDAKKEVKTSVFNNTMMGSFADQRKYIRNVKSMIDSGVFSTYLKKQTEISAQLEEKKKEAQIKTKEDLVEFVRGNEDLTEDLQMSMERSLLQSKKAQTKSKPIQLVNKSISELLDIDTRIIEKLADEDKERLGSQLQKLTKTVTMIQNEVGSPEEGQEQKTVVVRKELAQKTKNPYLGSTDLQEPFVFCIDGQKPISNLTFSLGFSAMKYLPGQQDSTTVLGYFIDLDYNELSPLVEIAAEVSKETRVNFTLKSSASTQSECYLILKNATGNKDEALQMIPFKLKFSFAADFNL